MVPKNLHDYIKVYKDFLDRELCTQTVKKLTEINWEDHSFYDYQISNSWINIYYNKDYQEFHNHPRAIFSAVYTFANPPGGGDFVIKSPIADFDMFPMSHIKGTNTLNATTHNYSLKPRRK